MNFYDRLKEATPVWLRFSELTEEEARSHCVRAATEFGTVPE